MEKLFIKETAISPKIIFNIESGTFELIGTCRPEHAADFFKEILNWLAHFESELKNVPSKKEFNFVFNFDYINSVSIKLIFDCFKIIERAYSVCGSINIIWYYNTGDTDMKETGEEYSHIINVPFKILMND